MALAIKLCQEGGANSLALNRDNSQVVIGGRNIFKLFNIEESEFVENCNLRVGKNLNLNFSCNDVAWNTLDDAIIATAATNGSVIIWNLTKPSRAKLDHIFNEHKRTVNKVTFKPTDSSLLLSGSQDGTMKYFDLRVRDAVKTFVSASASVRDIQFSPHQSTMFTSVSENGSVQLWDLRRNDRYFLQFTAHNGPIFSCDWHPEMRWLATASRDKTVRVWDMELKPTLEFMIHTVASIGHVKWRPSRKFHIASSALVFDSNINVWDIRRPYIPFASFDHHKDIATGIAWRGNPHCFLTTSRDGYLIQNVFTHCKRPADHANPQAVSINGKGNLLIATKREESIPRKPRCDEFLDAHSTLLNFIPTDRQETDAFILCARRYRLSGRPFSELCDINAGVARDAGLPQVALVWETIKVIYNYTPPVDEIYFQRSNDVILTEANVTKAVLSCDTPEEQSIRGMDTTVLEEEVDIDESDFLPGLRPPDVQAQGDFFFGDGELDPLSADQLQAITKCQPDWTVKAEAFVARHEIMEGAPPEPYGEVLDTTATAGNTTAALTVHSLPSLPPVRFHDIVVKTLWHHVDTGDIQTAVALLAVLGDRRRELDLRVSTQEHWLYTYLDLLDRHRLFPQAAQLIQVAWLPEINQLSQQSTTVYTICGSCNKPLSRTGWLCDRCRKAYMCSLCHQVVRGLLVWCYGCGHGGHMSHIRNWFKGSDQCPTGCGHLCEYD